MVPIALLPPVTPFTCQVTAVFVVFCTVAAKPCDEPVATLAAVGETETVTATGGGVDVDAALVIVTAAEAETLVFACETAVTITLAGFGTFVGAL